MLTSAHIQNFRCLRDVQFDLSPLTVLVGPNGSGKSAILDALSTGAASASDAYRHDTKLPITRNAVRNGEALRTSVRAQVGFRLPWTSRRLRLDPRAARSANQVQEARVLEETGANLVNLFATLPRTRQDAIAAALRERVPLFADLNATPSTPGQHRLLFTDRWSPTVRYEPAEVSDGTILLVAFLTLAHLEEPPELLCIEEPERSLHPYLLAEVLDLLRALTTGQLSPSGAPVQVLIATHSPQVVSLVRPEEVRFVSRSLDDGNTIVRAAPVDDDGFRAALKAHDDSLGNVWLSGGLGGVPGTPV